MISALKKYKPVTSSQRGLVLVDRSLLWKGKSEKSLTVGLSKTGGRNVHGRITCRHRGGGHKRSYRLINFKRHTHSEPATVERLEYDPNRSAFIALLNYDQKNKAYILAPQGLEVGQVVESGPHVDINIGNALPLKNIPIGTFIHNIELKKGKGAQLIRSAGGYGQVAGREMGYVLVKLSSGELRRVRSECFATIGSVSNPDHQNTNLAKAGRNRWKGFRPHVRGVAMNPIDHPHGGGEGRSSGGRHPVSPWGVHTKGKKTRRNKQTSRLIVRRRKN